MYARHGVDILMADDAQGLAAEIIRLYRDHELWESLARNGRSNVERHFSVTAARQAILESLQGVGLDFSAVDGPN